MKSYNITTRIISVFIVLLSIGISNQLKSQNNHFVYLENDNLYLQCEEFYPIAMNYHAAIIEDNTGTFHVAPQAKNCWKGSCNDQTMCGTDVDEWHSQIVDHLTKIVDLGFNSIRLLGYATTYDIANDKLRSKFYRTQSLNDPNCFTLNNTGYEINSSTYQRQGDLIEEFIYIIKDNNIPLKIILLTGGGGIENVAEEQANYLSYIANRFKNEPVIFAFDMYNEPSFWGYPVNTLMGKEQRIETTDLWYSALKEISPLHIVTIGVYISDVYDWDPELLPSDIFSLHIYSFNKQSESWLLEPPFNRSKGQLKCVSETYSKPWIIGETGFWGVDSIDPLPYAQVLTAEDQRWFAENILKYTNWYGAKGISWYQYKDSHLYNDQSDKAKSNFHGLVKREDFQDLPEEQKLAGQEFQSFDPDSFCNDCIHYDSAINPYGYGYEMVYGTITDENGNPLESVYISAQMGGPSYKSYKTYSYIDPISNNAEFKIFTEDATVVFDKIRFGYPGKELYTETDQLNGELNVIIPDYNNPLPTPVPTPPTSFVIENGEDITWDQPVTWKIENLTIETGAKLTISSYQYFDNGTKIIVERGGHLIIDGGFLSNACDGMWQGIEVQGNSNQPQLVAEQGWVEIINGGTIENSVHGIYTNKPDPASEGSYVVGYTGGIIEADSANFINNQISIYFHSYPSLSASYLKDCLFETNDDYIGNEYPDQFVKAVSMNGVDIINCDFVNDVSSGNDQKGLYSINSQIIVKGKCTSGSPCISWDYSKFENLQYGIYATAINNTRFIQIEHTDFINNFRGAFISGMSNAVVYENNFEINAPYSEYNGGYGLYLDYSTGYTVEENNFYHPNTTIPPEKGLGLVVNESGGKEPNMIYRNYFTNLECGMNLQGENRNKDGIGLQVKCNQYDGTLMDKIITWNEPFVNSQAGIAKHQGSSNGIPIDMAGNLFEVPSQTPNNDYDDILNEGNSITYYYASNSEEDDVKPIDYNSKVSPDDEIVDPEWSLENGCPPNESGSGGGIGDGKALVTSSQIQIDSIENILAVLIDGGNTTALQNEVDNSVPPETMEVYNDLLGQSPYLSDTVISTAIEKEDVLPNAMIRDIMVANPNAAKSDELINKLDARWNPLPEYMKAQILQGRSIVSLREETEATLAAYLQDEAKGFSSIIRGYLNDTINLAASRDSLMAFLEQNGTLRSKYLLAFMHLEHGTENIGLIELNNIPLQFDLRTNENISHQQIVNYYNLLSDLQTGNKSLLEIDNAQLISLIAMENTEVGPTDVYARNILLATEEITYEEPIILPDMLKAAEAQQTFDNLMEAKPPKQLEIYPNPSDDYVIMQFKIDGIMDGGIVEVSNMNGSIIKTLEVSIIEDQLVIDTQSWKTGIYIATLKVNGNSVESCKFTIID